MKAHLAHSRSKRSGLAFADVCTAAKAWYLRRLKKSLSKQRAKIEAKLRKAAEQAMANAKMHRHDPALQQRRQFLRGDHQTVCDRQLAVDMELAALRATR